MRDFKDILAAKDSAAQVEDLLTVQDLLPGYLVGGDLVFENEVAYVAPVAAGIRGKRIEVSLKTRLEDCYWEVKKINSYRYYIYLDTLAILHVDVIAPKTIDKFLGLYHPFSGWRYINTFYSNSVGRITEVSISTLSIIGYSGEGTPYAPVENDTRVVIESDEIKFQHYESGAWVTDINIQNTINDIEGSLITTYSQGTVPSDPTAGDTWYCTADVDTYIAGIYYRYSGSAWTVMVDNTSLRIEPILANFPGPITIGFYSKSGTTSYDSPGEGDRRTYIDEDEVGLQQYTNGAWTTVNQIKLGGDDGSGNFAPFLSCRGIVNSLTDSPGVNPFPGGFVFTYESGIVDQDGNSPEAETYIETSDVWSKFGTYSLRTSTTAQKGGLTKSTAPDYSKRFLISTWLNRIDNEYDSSANSNILFTFRQGYRSGNLCSATASIYVDTSNVLQFFCRVVVDGVEEYYAETSLGALSTGEHMVAILWVPETTTFSVFLDDTVTSVDIDVSPVSDDTPLLYPAEPFGTACQMGFRTSGYYSDSNVLKLYLDDSQFIVEDDTLSVDYVSQYYLSDLPWDLNYSAKDVIVNPAPGGAVRSLGNHIVENSLTVKENVSVEGNVAVSGNQTTTGTQEYAAYPWHEIGGTGEPAFENSWVNYGTGGHETAAFHLCDGGNSVELKGLVKDGTVGAYAVFTLPVEYRPSALFACVTISNSAIGRVDVLDTGEVRVTLGNNAWASLNGIRIPIA